PVLKTTFADPSIIQVNKTYYSFATAGPGIYGIQIAKSDDFHKWEHLKHDALPHTGTWVNHAAGRGSGVAPDVQQMADGSFVLYYTACINKQTPHKNTKCVGAATSKTIEGPYTPEAAPLACHLSQGGAIDISGFHDPTTHDQYVLYKVDGNNAGHGGLCMNMIPPIQATPIMLQKVTPNGLTAIGTPIQILDRDDTDGPLVEAPMLRKYGNKYVLFFSSNCFSSPGYDVSYAVADNITGPYRKASEPLFAYGKLGLDGPGGASVTTDGSKMVFHGHYSVKGQGMTRVLYTQEIKFDG
ncbi:glycoside hydrolase family 43 protein, partial [Viridothelium virens]